MNIEEKKLKLKSLNKELTALSNAIDKKLSSKTYSLFDEIHKEYMKCSHYEEKRTGGGETIYTKPYLREIVNLRSGYPEKVLKWNEDSEAINQLKTEYPDFAKRLLELYTAKIDLVNQYIEVKKDFNSLKEDLEGGNKAQILFKAMISKEKNEEKVKAFNKFIYSLKDWKAPEIINNEIFINGKKVEANTLVGIIIGQGDKIHPMPVNIFTDDSETKEKFIGVNNFTQWRRSELCVVDVMENIPKDIIAYAKDDEDTTSIVDGENLENKEVKKVRRNR